MISCGFFCLSGSSGRQAFILDLCPSLAVASTRYKPSCLFGGLFAPQITSLDFAMSSTALTAKYRPQTFDQVAGQDTVKSILSRASLEQRVAPAYLFSGTRGVGKTTLARIFAKALNCRTAPTAEPCNVCDQCRAITAGSAVDVVEIDGASNRGIDDVRRLKEVVGYAPMEGGYKIFIIDEAHMLSREAFNEIGRASCRERV